MEEAFQKALATLCALPEGEAISLLARLAAAASETGEEAVLLSPAQRDTLGEQVVAQANALLPKGKLTLGPAAPEISGGLILRQGAVDINCSFAMLLRHQRAQLNGPVAALLFPRTGPIDPERRGIMANQIHDTDYLFLTTRVRSLECQLLDRGQMEQMLEAATPRRRPASSPTAATRSWTPSTGRLWAPCWPGNGRKPFRTWGSWSLTPPFWRCSRYSTTTTTSRSF